MHHPRLGFHTWPAAIYAIGDVHGCLPQLQALETEIIRDAAGMEGEKWLVTLGDHIDRGPDSAGVIEHLLAPAPAGFRRFALLGNHEALALDFLAGQGDGTDWLDEGGAETVRSYGLDPGLPPERIVAALPEAHLRFLEALPLYLSLPGWLFVHAGIRPGLPLSEQSEDDLIWIRQPFLTSQPTGGLRVVHGHTPGTDIVATPHRIDVDTGCFASGRLSSVRVTPDSRVHYFTVSA